MKRSLPVLGLIASCGAALCVLPSLGGPSLAGPPLDPGLWARWVGDRDAVLVVVALLRLAVVATAWYLLAVTLLGVAARAARSARLVRLSDLVTIPAARRLLNAAVGVSVTASSFGAVPAAAATQPVAVVTAATEAEADATSVQQRFLGGDADIPRPTRATQRFVDEGIPATATQRLLPPGPAAPADAPPPAALDVPAAVDVDDPAGLLQADVEATHVVAAGDHLWSIAEGALARAWGRAPADAEVTSYWAEVVAANSDLLPDPGNPDLIFPGQVLRLPPPPPSP